ncbi:MAG: hypothetical protein SGILL_008984, partial [Bacillariaceae sp.]
HIPEASLERPKKANSSTVTYRLTTSKETGNVRAIDTPLGPMIEFFAYKIGCRSDQTLRYLIRLDKELSKSRRTAPTSKEPARMTRQEVLDAVMRPAIAKER